MDPDRVKRYFSQIHKVVAADCRNKQIIKGIKANQGEQNKRRVINRVKKPVLPIHLYLSPGFGYRLSHTSTSSRIVLVPQHIFRIHSRLLLFLTAYLQT